MKRFLTALVSFMGATSLAIVSAPSATAAPDLDVNFDAGVACEFPLDVLGTGSTARTHELTVHNGDVGLIIEAGKGYTLTYTNSDTGKSITFRSNGSVSKTVVDPKTGAATVRISGHTGLILFPSDIPAGPSTTQYIGTVVFTIDPEGVFDVQSVSGTAIDICAALS
ncbi:MULTISPECIES: hypothetical protein [unclassified Arthrobacter]|jgi:hypothetical protein|uniref:hypothetical protein n=1 Tax=unclassified Arthrobacter TaxID=235627 RepID=UPI00036D1F4D|nr:MULTISPECIES: hypothetical protein [unclassified Arthrobacter]BCW54428.1 hypothetical protein StoSoilB19_18020 [Arthrobacter sp. StoSoilB19]